MRLPKFEYRAPETIDEAITILSERGEGARIISGGTDILVAMKQRRLTPTCLVDLKGIHDLAYIENGKDAIRIGPLTTLDVIEGSAVINEYFPMLAKAAGDVGAPQHRNKGTIGGNICLNTRCWYYNQSPFFRKCRPVCYKLGGEEDKCQLFPTRQGKANVCYSVYSGDTAPPLVALGAEVKVIGPEGERVVPLTKILTGDGKRPIVFGPAEILTEVIIPKPPPYSFGKYLKYRVREAIDFPLLGVAAMVTLDSKEGLCTGACVVIGAVASGPVKVENVEDILKGNKITDTLIEEVSEAAFKEARPLPNLIGSSPEYRRRLVKIFCRRILKSVSLEN
jgi:4-hydroxybenzoyl-CoA reductase subunit beta